MKRTLSYLFVFVVATAVFLPGVTDGHLNLDDWGYTLGCPFVKDGVTSAGLARALLDVGYGGIWMPLTYLTYMLDFSLFGGSWQTHHLVNVALHAVNAVLVLALLFRLTDRFAVGTRPRLLELACVMATLFWALHPMRTEAVVWIASRKEELWTFFALLGSLAWIASLEKGGLVRYILALGFFAAAMLAKPSAVCIPLLAGVMEAFAGPRKGHRFLRYAPLMLLSLAVGVIAVVSQTHPTGMAPVDVFETTLAWRTLNAAVSLGLYLFHTLVPVGLHLDYRAVIGGWPLDGTLGLVALGVAVSGLVWAGRRWRDTPVAAAVRLTAAWFLVALLPVLGIVGFTGDKACADRYAYMPSVALAVLLALGLSALARKISPRWIVAGAGLLLLGEIAVTEVVVASFENDAAVYSRVLAEDPDHWRALRVIGCERCARQNRMDEGVAMLRRSLRLRYSQQTAASLAYVLACRGADGDFADVRRLGMRVAANPKLDAEGLMLDALAISAFREGDDKAAVRWFTASLTAPRRSHNNLHAMLNFGFALANVGRKREAEDMFVKLRNVSDRQVRERAAAAKVLLRQANPPRFEWQ